MKFNSRLMSYEKKATKLSPARSVQESRTDSGLIIGLDLDNTLISYDNLFYTLALEQGLVTPETSRTKQAVKEAVRKLPHGVIVWCKLQAQAYGYRILEAALSPGAKDFLVFANQMGCKIFVVSHKTRYPAAGGPNLHRAALDFLESNELIGPQFSALRRECVYFEATRRDKCLRIRALGCTHFVDDLPEVLTDPDFPRGVGRYLFAPEGAVPPKGVVAVRSMIELSGQFFGPEEGN